MMSSANCRKLKIIGIGGSLKVGDDKETVRPVAVDGFISAMLTDSSPTRWDRPHAFVIEAL